MYQVNLLNFVILQIIIIILVIILGIYLVRLMIANKYNKKFSQFVYSEDSVIDNSIEAKISRFIIYLISALSYLLNKLHLFKRMRLKYNKYLFINSYYLKENIDFISLKILFNILALSICIIFLLFSFTYYNLIICTLFIILINLLIMVSLNRYLKYYQKRLNNELINIIYSINSSLMVGLNITEALNNAKNKSNPLLKQELSLIIDDINNGLSIEKAFNHLYNRINTDEILYLSNILSVLSKSGGSIEEAFLIIEDDYEKKIKREKQVTQMLLPYRFIFNALGFLPLFIFLYRLLVKPSIFVTLFNSLYYTILVILIIIYNTCYFIIINNLMEVIHHE